MTHDPDQRPDQRIADLLRADLSRDAPAERDAMFRVAVLARRERARYRRSLYALVAGGLTLAVLAVIGVSGGGSAREATGVLLIGVALTTVYFILAPALTQLLARFRS